MTAAGHVAAWAADLCQQRLLTFLARGDQFAAMPGTTKVRSWLGMSTALTTLAVAGSTWAGTVAANMADGICAQVQPTGVVGTDGTPNAQFLLPCLAEAVLLLDVDPDSKARWTASLVQAATAMRDGVKGVAGAQKTWWTNGNIECAEALTYHLVWRVTGDAQWSAACDAQLAFILHPTGPSPSIVGAGTVITNQPSSTDSDWRDAEGYITEAGPGGVGWDGGYSILQSVFLSRMWGWSRDVRVLRLLHLVTNYLFAKVDPVTWMLNGTGGTRHPYPQIPFDTPAVATLEWADVRTDWRGKAQAQFAVVVDTEARSWATSPIYEGEYRCDALWGWVRADPAWPGYTRG